MMSSDVLWVRDAVLVALVLVTSWTDVRYERIRNVHTFPAMGLGLLFGLLSGGLSGLGSAALGLAVGLLSMGVLFAAGVMKAGDVKLSMGIGALIGAWPVLRTVILSFILYLPVGLVYLVARGDLRNLWIAVKRMARFVYTFFHPALEAEKLPAEGMTLAPFGMVLGVAAWLVHFAGWFTAEHVIP
jgi:Flp pilus assembly protein protease CpaA